MTTTTTTDLVSNLRKWLRGRLGAVLFSFLLEVEPVPASRPRVTQWGTHYTKTYTAYRKSAAEAMKDVMEQSCPDESLVVLTEVICTKPRTGKLSAPKGDIDNYEKSIFDTITKAGNHWNDDRQIVGALSFKRYAQPGETPGFHVTAYAL